PSPAIHHPAAVAPHLLTGQAIAGPASRQWAAEEAAHPPVVLADDRPAADCLAGEKMWRNRGWMMDSR
ncbi:hypothetical protein EOA51_18015, partial [Mesorhizobium sp. M1A.F.Ca.IN.020.32.1.1]